jgi:hypothetical protein
MSSSSVSVSLVTTITSGGGGGAAFFCDSPDFFPITNMVFFWGGALSGVCKEMFRKGNKKKERQTAKDLFRWSSLKTSLLIKVDLLGFVLSLRWILFEFMATIRFPFGSS